MFMPGCWCCNTCTIFSDDFSTDRTGSDYTTVAGSFSVGSGVMTSTTSNSLIIENTARDSGATGGHSTVTMQFANAADVGRLIDFYVDSNNYWFVELKCNGGFSTDGTLKLFSRVAGVNTQQGATQTVIGLQINTNVTVCLSAASGYVMCTATVSTIASLGVAASPTAASVNGGLATGNVTSSVTFDNYSFNKHAIDDSNCAACTGCPTICTAPPSSVSLTFAGVVAGAGPHSCASSGGSFSGYNATFIVPSTNNGPLCNGGFTNTTGICSNQINPDVDTFTWSYSGGATLRFSAFVQIITAVSTTEFISFGSGSSPGPGVVGIDLGVAPPANCIGAGTANPVYESAVSTDGDYTDWSSATCTAVPS